MVNNRPIFRKMNHLTLSVPRLEFLPKFLAKSPIPFKLNNGYSIVNRTDIPTSSGVYFLLDADDISFLVVYVGQTMNLRLRIAGHLGSGKKFNNVSFVLEENPILRLAIEQLYINEYHPVSNGYDVYNNDDYDKPQCQELIR